MTLPNTRKLYLAIFAFTVAMISIALYMEHVMNLEPCPLCISQRVCFMATGLVALIAALHNPQRVGQKVYGILATLAAVSGGGFALRQMYLQSLPEDQIPQCLPSLSYMWEIESPLIDIIKLLLQGDGNCAEIVWVDPILGLGIPHWALVGFVLLAATSLFQTFRNRR